jgi:hypothetical protein
MKSIKYSFGLIAALMLFVTSCIDFVEPRIPYSTFDTGAYLRTIARTSVSFNFFNLAGSNFALTLEAVDAENGATLESVEIRVRHVRLIPGVGQQFIPAGTATNINDVLIKTLQASDFAQTADSKFLRTSFNITAPETLAALGVTPAAILGGDTFEFRLVLRDKKGRVFKESNASADIKGGLFYQSPFLYRVNVVCPSSLGGTFAYSTTNITAGAGGNAAACGPTKTGNVTLTAVANTVGVYTVSDASFGVFDCAYGDTPPGGTVRLNDSCGRLFFTGADKYGDTYSLTFISNNGSQLVFSWVNSYGDSGVTTLTAPSGFTWPNTLK